MSSVCSEQHKLLLSLKKSLTLRDINDISDIDTPPRRLLTRRTTTADMFSDDDPYSSDHFRMFEFKIRRCTRSRSHDWTDCPFAHPGEKARRRDPRRFQYSGEVCPEYRRGNCSRGDACEFSHGVFECYLHPSRYRTEACKDGKNCKRKVCFFAHTPRQLRVLPPPPSSPSQNKIKNNHCCSFCHCSTNSSYSTCSPTSTLFGVSHFTNSPPMSPSSPPPSRFVGSTTNSKEMDVHVLNELMCSLELEALNSPTVSRNFPWLDVSDSPSAASASSFSPTLKFSNSMREERKVVDDVTVDPDFGWVNDLLMN